MQREKLLRYSKLVAVGLLAIWLVYFLSGIFIYLLVAMVVVLILRPVYQLVMRIRLGRLRPSSSFAAGVAVLFFFVAIGTIFALLVPAFFGELSLISNIKPQQILENLSEPIAQYERFMAKYGIEVDTDKLMEKALRENLQNLLDISAIGNLLGTAMGLLGEVVIGIFAVAFIAFFFLRDRKLFPTIVLFLSPVRFNRPLIRIIYKIKQLLRRYFTGITIQVLILTTLVYTGLSLIGVESAFFIAVFAGLLNIIPYLGPILGFGLAMVISLATALNGGDTQIGFLVLKLMGVFAAVQLTDNILLQPLIYGSSVKAHPLEIFLVILIGAQIAGIIGMVLAVPAYTVLRVVAAEFLRGNAIVNRLTARL